MRVFSGIQPTGHLHIGNYLGALRQFVTLQERADCLFCVVDLHALTVPQDPETLRRDTRQIAALYLACGIDPAKSTVFVQSHVPPHSELSWLLGCVATYGELRRMTQFKDKSQGQESVPFGLLAYPVLMAADILLYRATAVPVGEDQKQHLELSRDLAARFNARFGETFPVPEPLIGQQGARVMSLQNPAEKMSKSAADAGSRVELLDVPDVVRKKLKRAVTDSEREVRHDPVAKPAVSNLLEIFSLVAGESIGTLEARYGDSGYGQFKQDLGDAIVAFLDPIQKRHAELQAAPDHLDAVLRKGAQRALELAAPVMDAVRHKMGLMVEGRHNGSRP